MPAAGESQAANESVKTGAILMKGSLVREIDLMLFTFNTARRRACVAEDSCDQMSSKASFN
jgi:hypothetical protein